MPVSPGSVTGHADALERMTRKTSKGKRPVPSSADPAFDHWVARQLHKMYDEVLSEEVPEELLRLVEKPDGERARNDQRDGDEASDDAPEATRKR
jgi:hypothetical protein